MSLDAVPCPACLREATLHRSPFDASLFLRWDQVSLLYRCRTCGHLFHDPVPSEEDLAQFYQEEYGAGSPDYYTAAHDYEPGRHDDWIHFVEKEGPPSSSESALRGMDIGCSFGGFVGNMRARGYDFQGTDIAESAVHSGIEMGNDAISVRDYRYDESLGKFDLVTCSHVIEHLRAPGDLIGEINRYLEPGGWLFLRFPSGIFLPGILDLVTASTWFGFPMHLHYFTPRSIVSLLARNGYRVSVVSSGHPEETQLPDLAQLTGLEASEVLSGMEEALLGRELFVAAQYQPARSPAIESGRPTGQTNRWSSSTELFTDGDDWALVGKDADDRPAPFRLDPRLGYFFLPGDRACQLGPGFIHAGSDHRHCISWKNRGSDVSVLVYLRIQAITPRCCDRSVKVTSDSKTLLGRKLTGTTDYRFILPARVSEGSSIHFHYQLAEGKSDYGTCAFSFKIRVIAATDFSSARAIPPSDEPGWWSRVRKLFRR